jgi:DNA-directed RNA polymerase subunit RPC12/RpoP
MICCKKCGGRIVIETVGDLRNTTEITCLRCGKRWFLKDDHQVARWLRPRLLNM